MTPRIQRLTNNEKFARRINEVAEHERSRNGFAGNAFLCECCRESCVDTIEIEAAEYTRVRQDPRRFVVREGHENREIESVVERYPKYVVVQKHGEAGRLAEADAA